jgi:hypothetical protein
MKWLNSRLRIFIILIVCVVISGTAGFAAFEGLSYSNAAYLTMITISTVGYGDFYPVTAAGKALAVFLILVGTGSFLGLLATLTETFMSRRERTERLESVNIAVGAFFREVGFDLLKSLSCLEKEQGKTKERFSGITAWSERDFARAKRSVRSMGIRIDADKADIKHIEKLISEKRALMFRMLENPNLHEHETFTDLLHAVFHVSEEFEEMKAREKRKTYGDHVWSEITDVYLLLIYEWLGYMGHLKSNYPHFFSFAAETIPFCGVADSRRKAKKAGG